MTALVVHRASLRLAGEGDPDPGAPGAAITVELCGHWEHEGSCRRPHHTSYVLDGRTMVLRCLAVGEPTDDLHAAIGRALATGHLDGPSGTTRWTVVDEGASELLPDEEDLAERLRRSRPA